jgi:hypothetical protein
MKPDACIEVLMVAREADVYIEAWLALEVCCF